MVVKTSHCIFNPEEMQLRHVPLGPNKWSRSSSMKGRCFAKRKKKKTFGYKRLRCCEQIVESVDWSGVEKLNIPTSRLD